MEGRCWAECRTHQRCVWWWLEECGLPLRERVHVSFPSLFSSFDEFQTLLLLFVARYPSQLQPFSSLFKALSKSHVQKRSSGAFLASFAVPFLSYQNSCCSDYRTQQLLPPFWYIYYRQSHAGYYPTTEPYSTEMVLWLSAGSAVAMATQQGFFLSGKFFICAFRYSSPSSCVGRLCSSAVESYWSGFQIWVGSHTCAVTTCLEKKEAAVHAEPTRLNLNELELLSAGGKVNRTPLRFSPFVPNQLLLLG